MNDTQKTVRTWPTSEEARDRAAARGYLVAAETAGLVAVLCLQTTRLRAATGRAALDWPTLAIDASRQAWHFAQLAQAEQPDQVSADGRRVVRS